MTIVIAICIGAIAGALSRYALSQTLNSDFQTGTLIANALGCFVLGCVWGLSFEKNISASIYTGIIVGFCGSLTTFSTIIYDVFKLASTQQQTRAVMYFVLTHVMGIFSMGSGLIVVRAWIKFVTKV